MIAITGANRGIGKATTEALASTQATIVMACRDVDKAEEARQQISERSGNPNIAVMALDLSSIRSVDAFVSKLKRQYSRVDVLICNAGVWCKQGGLESADGVELTWAVNHLGHFWLALSLRHWMQRSAHARLIVTSSIMHRAFGSVDCCRKRLLRLNEFDVDALGRASACRDASRAYSLSKLCNVMFVREWSKRHSEVLALCVHPGFGATDLFQTDMDTSTIKNNCCLRCLYNVIAKCVLDTPQQLAFTQCYCAVTEARNLTAGGYYRCTRRRSVSSAATDDANCRALWRKSIEIIERIRKH